MLYIPFTLKLILENAVNKSIHFSIFYAATTLSSLELLNKISVLFLLTV